MIKIKVISKKAARKAEKKPPENDGNNNNSLTLSNGNDIKNNEDFWLKILKGNNLFI